ncbi:MAG: signal recognition particle-docking protein FtsY [Oscillospiraceae bacterium]|nr:signal recognition particle-docking protein FtsY [Oscillospiraceae bacterium]
MAIFKKINFGLSKTRNKMSGAIDDMLDSFDSFEENLYTELEEILVMGDVGVTTAVQVVEELKDRVKSEKIKKPSEVKKELQSIIADLLYGGEDMGLITIPSVILMIGVNGAGKTTTIGKMAAMYKSQGKKVILGAADTFRAAAIDQLDVWAERAGVDIVKHKEGADPAAVVYDTIQAGIARNCDIIILDTAGRLHNKKNLMEELGKIYRVMDKELPYADREVLLVLDAVTGQNAVNQAREFAGVTELTGIVLTKLDGTARGGVVLSIKNDLKIPVKFIGVGEGLDDLQPFDPAAFAKSLFQEADKLEDDENENSLEGLINSEEYQNYVPQEEEGQEDLEQLAKAAGELLAGLYEEDENLLSVEPDEGQEDASSYEEAEKDFEEADEETEQAPQENREIHIEEQVYSELYSPEETAYEQMIEETEAPAEEEVIPEEESPSEEEIAPEEAPIREEISVETEAPAEKEITPVEVPEELPAEEEKPKKKERRGLFGFFNRHS